ncbi:hypothetical protein PF005_g2085 [Phytophthora fragariae]|uniref:Uncharacterized protein n=1 Tax=Phytophthora fragariae TaxID=53985 RepID=A0A6A3ZFN4_9STRA|nr:hypothetical protein PF005_g2085 [Phytophthora fragariae]
MGICTATSLITGAVAWYCIDEEKVERRSMHVELGKLFDLIQYRVVYQVLAYQFFGNMFSYVSVTASTPLQSVWLTISPVNSSIATIISTFISMASLLAVAAAAVHVKSSDAVANSPEFRDVTPRLGSAGRAHFA